MKGRQIVLVVTCALCLVGVVCSAETVDTEITSEEEPCCFENPRFSGTCRVTPGPEETCGDILAYLNNPNSVGRGYCKNTTVRGGWTQVACDGAASTATASQCHEDRE